MSRKKKKPNRNSGDSIADRDQASSDAVRTSGWAEKKPKIRWKTFPGPRGIDEPVRLCVSRNAYADLVSHAKQSLTVEVCGVLIGEFREDDEGDYVFVEAVIQGEAAKESGARVTFTQETWNHIHECRERDYPKREIVGWYHTHPGFGVEFSEMDLFIQRNFFSQRNQVALVSDPLGGEEAVCVNTADGIEHLSRFWVEGRERSCRLPGSGKVPAKGIAAAQPQEWAGALKGVEDRLGQLIATVEEQRAALYRFLQVLGMVACVGIMVAIGYSIYNRAVSGRRPPETMRHAEIPVRVGDETYFLGVQVVRWKAPDRVWNGLMKAVKQALEAEEEARKKAEEELRKRRESEQDKQPSSQPDASRGVHNTEDADDGTDMLQPDRPGAEGPTGSDEP